MRRTGLQRLGVLAGVAAFLGAAPDAARSAVADVDLALVLAVDVSRSMDFEEQQLQRDGYVAALTHPEVLQAIASGGLGRIAVTYFEWAGPYHQATIVPWTVIAGRADAEAFAAQIAAAPIARETGTSISGGLEFAESQLRTSGLRALRRAIDVSGDGPNNMGLPVTGIRDRIVADGITINGLPILLKTSGFASPFSIPDLDVYYEDCVIGGPGAFVITVDDMGRFAVAVRRKLVLEIAGLPARVIPAAAVSAPPRVDCMIGEKLRGRWLDR